MASSFSDFLSDNEKLLRSAPPQLDSSTLFAYPVSPRQFEYRSLSHGLKSGHNASEISDLTKDAFSDSAVEEPRSVGVTRNKSTRSLVNDMIALCMTDEDSPHLTCASAALISPPPFLLFNPSLVEVSGKVSNCFFFEQIDHRDLSHILSQAYAMSKDQIGCRHLQKKLEERDTYFTTALISTLAPHLIELMVDPFGNYLCQKLIEVSEPVHIAVILKVCEEFLVELALDPHGTRAVQKLVEVAGKSMFQSRIVEALKLYVADLAKDINGNHVIQRCLHVMGSPSNQFIYDAAYYDLLEISTHRHGCCVLQRCIDAADEGQRKALVASIVKDSVALVQDAFGNYVVQYVLDLNIGEANAELAKTFIDHMFDLARQKFSSNVIEKCLQQNPPEVQLQMIEAICSPKSLGFMLGDSYANYGEVYAVVQRAISLAPYPTQAKILSEVKLHLETLKRSQVGNRVYSKLVKRYPQLVDRRHYRS
jgi:hypothetical protein